MVTCEGRTKYERMLGHRSRHAMVEFGEVPMLRTAIDKAGRYKSYAYRYELNRVLLGVETSTSEVRLSVGSTVYTVSFQSTGRVIRENSYTADYLGKTTTSLIDYVAKRASTSSQGLEIFEDLDGIGNRKDG